MTRTIWHRSPIARLALAPLTWLRAAFGAIDAGITFGLPGYQAMVAKPVRVRTTTDPYYRGNPTQPARRNRGDQRRGF